MNLYKLALGGLNAAQAGIATTSHNINNSTTVGYNRQRVMTSTAGAQATSNGFIGRGVQVDTVVRSYDSFLYKQLVGAQGSGAQLQTQFDQISQVNNLFADRTVGIAPALSGFFTGVNTAANAPADPAARSDMLGKSNSLATQIRSAYQEMQNQRLGLNTQVGTVVEQTNSYLARINDLNEQISAARAKAGGQPPNDLMDQRDQAVSELNQLVGITTYEQGDKLNISLASGGQALLSGQTIYPLQAVPLVQGHQPHGGGLYAAGRCRRQDRHGRAGRHRSHRRQARWPAAVPRQLAGRDAEPAWPDGRGPGAVVQCAAQAGPGPERQPRWRLLQHRPAQGVPNAQNKSNAQISGTFGTVGNINAKDYDITFDGTNYMVTRMPEGTQVYNGPATGTPPTATLDLDAEAGVRLTISAPPQAGDKWSLSPTRDAARDLNVVITDPNKIALADATGGNANGKNGLKLAQLQTAKVLGGNTTSINEMFSQVVNTVGVQTQQIKSAATAQANLITQKRPRSRTSRA